LRQPRSVKDAGNDFWGKGKRTLQINRRQSSNGEVSKNHALGRLGSFKGATTGENI